MNKAAEGNFEDGEQQTPRKVVRAPKLFVHLSSTNLVPDSPVGFNIHASTHHWRGELLEDTWAAADMDYLDIHQTEAAYQHFRDSLMALQETAEPSKDIVIPFPENGVPSVEVTAEDSAYWDAVQLATSKGWAWEDSFHENLLTGVRTRAHGPFDLSLYSWEWAGHRLGSRVSFDLLRKDGESKAGLLLRTLDLAERAKQEYTDAVPYNMNGQLSVHALATRLTFGN